MPFGKHKDTKLRDPKSRGFDSEDESQTCCREQPQWRTVANIFRRMFGAPRRLKMWRKIARPNLRRRLTTFLHLPSLANDSSTDPLKVALAAQPTSLIPPQHQPKTTMDKTLIGGVKRMTISVCLLLVPYPLPPGVATTYGIY